MNVGTGGAQFSTSTTPEVVSGNKTNNNAAPGATNVGTLPALANASSPSWTEGNQVTESVDLSGNQRTTLGTLGAGEDLSGNGGVSGSVLGVVQKPVVTSAYSYSVSTSFGTATKANAKATPGSIFSVFASNANASVRFLQLHNKASAPAGTDVPIFSFPIPAGTANNPGVLILDNEYFLQNGYYLSLGVGWAISTTVATFTDSATASEHDVNLNYL